MDRYVAQLKRLPWVRIAGVALLVAALVQGIALAVYLFGNEPEMSPALPAPTAPPIPAEATSTTTLPPLPPLPMPSLLGMNADRAIEILEDNGAVGVAVESVPWIGEAGIVVGQSPDPGEAIPDGPVTLRTSEAAITPDLSGLTQDAVRSALAAAGAEASFDVAYQPGATPGTVIFQDAEPGGTLPETVTATIAAAPSQIWLTELTRVARDHCGNGSYATNGVEYEQAVRCEDSVPSETAFAEYDLSRDFETFRAVIGVFDGADIGSVFHFRVLSADELLFEQTLGFGESQLIELDVTDVLRLRIEADLIGPEDLRPAQFAVWGDPLLIGDPAAVARIRQ